MRFKKIWSLLYRFLGMAEKTILLDTAKLAKELGFREQCWHFYCTVDSHLKVPYKYSFEVDANRDSLDNFGYGQTWSAPTQAHLQQWLREKYDIDVIPVPHKERQFNYTWMVYKNRIPIFDSELLYVLYERAFEAGLKQTLNWIKTGNWNLTTKP